MKGADGDIVLHGSQLAQNKAGIYIQEIRGKLFSRKTGLPTKLYMLLVILPHLQRLNGLPKVVQGAYTKAGQPARWVAWEIRDSIRVRVVYEPANGKIITAFPDNNPMPPALKPI